MRKITSLFQIFVTFAINGALSRPSVIPKPITGAKRTAVDVFDSNTPSQFDIAASAGLAYETVTDELPITVQKPPQSPQRFSDLVTETKHAIENCIRDADEEAAGSADSEQVVRETWTELQRKRYDEAVQGIREIKEKLDTSIICTASDIKTVIARIDFLKKQGEIIHNQILIDNAEHLGVVLNRLLAVIVTSPKRKPCVLKTNVTPKRPKTPSQLSEETGKIFLTFGKGPIDVDKARDGATRLLSPIHAKLFREHLIPAVNIDHSEEGHVLTKQDLADCINFNTRLGLPVFKSLNSQVFCAAHHIIYGNPQKTIFPIAEDILGDLLLDLNNLNITQKIAEQNAVIIYYNKKYNLAYALVSQQKFAPISPLRGLPKYSQTIYPIFSFNTIDEFSSGIIQLVDAEVLNAKELNITHQYQINISLKDIIRYAKEVEAGIQPACCSFIAEDPTNYIVFDIAPILHKNDPLSHPIQKGLLIQIKRSLISR